MRWYAALALGRASFALCLASCSRQRRAWKKKELWIELLGVLFSVSLDCYKQFIICSTTLNWPTTTTAISLLPWKTRISVQWKLQFGHRFVSNVSCNNIKQSKQYHLWALWVPGVPSKFHYSVCIIQKCEETIYLPLHLSRQIHTYPISCLLSDIRLAPPSIRTKSKNASSLTKNTSALNSFGSFVQQ